jgi:hypothetical protein
VIGVVSVPDKCGDTVCPDECDDTVWYESREIFENMNTTITDALRAFVHIPQKGVFLFSKCTVLRDTRKCNFIGA